jgi:hypothetical protein
LSMSAWTRIRWSWSSVTSMHGLSWWSLPAQNLTQWSDGSSPFSALSASARGSALTIEDPLFHDASGPGDWHYLPRSHRLEPNSTESLE